MQSQTLILAGIAAFYPVGLIAVGVLLATDRAVRLGLWFLAGAAVSLFVVGTLVITLLHGAGLSGGTRHECPGQPQGRPGDRHADRRVRHRPPPPIPARPA